MFVSDVTGSVDTVKVEDRWKDIPRFHTHFPILPY
jgi:hypothetical protein